MTKKKKEVDNAAILADVVVKGIQEKKGSNILLMDMRGLANSVTDIMVIANADSSTQVAAIADSVEDEVRKVLGENPWHTEGYENSLWILLDYVNVVVHIFQPDVRDYYQIEKLWADAEFKWIKD
jgi:ribosome-associated protein